MMRSSVATVQRSEAAESETMERSPCISKVGDGIGDSRAGRDTLAYVMGVG